MGCKCPSTKCPSTDYQEIIAVRGQITYYGRAVDENLIIHARYNWFYVCIQE